MGKTVDMTGKRIGNVTVIERAGSNDRHEALWLCRCDCGNEMIVRGTNLRHEFAGSCGCQRKRRWFDLTGRLFGKLTAVKCLDETKTPESKWLCRCECGGEMVATYEELQGSIIRNCGCEQIARDHHGMSGTALYRAIGHIRDRCYNPNDKFYADYGGRGIKVCDEWMDKEHGKSNFIRWSLEHGYADGLSIDRIDVNGDYTPENCRWTTASVQMFNRRKAKSKLGIRGVYKNGNDTYTASITVNMKCIHLGRYKNVEDAVAARKAAEMEYFGQVLD